MNYETYKNVVSMVIENHTSINEISNYHKILCYLNNKDYDYDEKQVVDYISSCKFTEYDFKFTDRLNTDYLESLEDDLVEDKVIKYKI